MDFFLIGAPKTGTTAIAKYLAQHPEVDFSRYKEPNYFSEDIVGSDRFVTNIEDYNELYSNDGRLRGEGSTTYLYSELAIKDILKVNPDAKFIVGVRDYVSLVQSQFNQMLKVGFENVSDFSAAWDLQSERAKGKKIPSSCTIPFNLEYKKIISLGYYLDRLFSIVKRENVFIFSFEDLNEDFNAVYKKILHFLKLSLEQNIVVERVNVAQAPKNQMLMSFLQKLTIFRKKVGLSGFAGVGKRLREMNLSKASQKKIPEHYQEIIKREMRSDADLLQKIIGEL